MYEEIPLKSNSKPSKVVKYSFSTFIIIFTLTIGLQLDVVNIMNNIHRTTLSFIHTNSYENHKSYTKQLQEGWNCYKSGDLANARILMSRVLKATNETSALYCLGLISIDEGKIEEGIERLEQVYVRQPKHVPTILKLSKIYYEKRYYIRSEALLEKAISLEPNNAEVQLWLGKTYVKMGKKEKALTLLNHVKNGKAVLEAQNIIKKFYN